MRDTRNISQVWLRSAGAVLAAGALIFGMTGCNGCGANTPAPITNAQNGADPADANLAIADGSQPTQVMGQSASYTPQQSSESYGPGQQAPAPIVYGNGSQSNSSQNEAYNYNTQPNGYYDNGQVATDDSQAYSQGYNNGQTDAYAQTDQAPPELPVYDQPPAPDPDDIWTPGYWGYANTGYYWNPGAWVAAPFIGALWTPGYWGWYGGHYRFHHGYWGRHIGYYGGINYGHGYIGSGYYGGYWNRDHFYYNNAVTRVSPRITNVYQRNVVVNNVHYTAISNNRVSFNGGRGGVNYQPRPFEVAAMHEQHVGPVPAQQQFHREAAMNRANFYADNHGRPAQVALAQPVRTERIAAPPVVNRGGFGGHGPGAPGGAATPGVPNAFNQHNGAQQRGLLEQRTQQLQQRNQNEQQRNVVEQQRNQQLMQRNGAEQQRNFAEQQRNQQLQQRNGTEQQRNFAEQQHNQQLQQRNQAEQQRNIVQQQHIQQLQGNNNALEQQHALQQQRNVAEQQRNVAEQQRNQQLQQHVQQPQQFQQRNFSAQQPQRIAEQPRLQPQQPRVEQPRPQAFPQAQPHFEQRAAPQVHMETPRPAPQPQMHMEAPRPAPAPHIEAPRAAPAPHMEAPHAAPGGGGGHHR